MRALPRELASTIGEERVLAPEGPAATRYLSDATESRGLRGRADAIVLPETAEQVAATLAYCYEHDIPLTTRGGGTGFAGGAVPDGGVLLATEQLQGVPRVDPERWLLQTPAAATTADIRRRAREEGLYFPPDPGSQEQSLIGGNIATNAGGPHTFKYGVTRNWVAALQVAIAPGRLVTLGGPHTKDVAAYDLKALMVGSEGTLGIVTAATLHLTPAPELQLPILARYRDTAAGTAAIGRVLACGTVPAALEYLDTHTTEDASFIVLVEADGDADTATRAAAELQQALGPGSTSLEAPTERAEIAALWRWRDGVSLGVTARRGGKLSEDIVVPVSALAEAIEETVAIGARHGLEACSWGHAGDGNLHSTFMIDRTDQGQIAAAEAAAEELFAMARRLGGSISGEHGIGLVKRRAAAQALDAAVIELDTRIKAALDPKGLLNPGKKLP